MKATTNRILSRHLTLLVRVYPLGHDSPLLRSHVGGLALRWPLIERAHPSHLRDDSVLREIEAISDGRHAARQTQSPNTYMIILMQTLWISSIETNHTHRLSIDRTVHIDNLLHARLAHRWWGRRSRWPSSAWWTGRTSMLSMGEVRRRLRLLARRSRRSWSGRTVVRMQEGLRDP